MIMKGLDKSTFNRMTQETAYSIVQQARCGNIGLGIILGTGANRIARLAYNEGDVEIDYEGIYPTIPGITIEGQKSKIVILKDRLPGPASIILFGRRSHTFRFSGDYVTPTPDEIALEVGYIPSVLMHLTRHGRRTGAIITTDAVGGSIHNERKGKVLRPGDIGVVSGYYTLGRGVHIGQAIGNPFLDRRDMMDKKSISLARTASEISGIPTYSGDLYAVHGPDLETSPEYTAFLLMGIPFVGMTGPEAEVWHSLKKNKPLRNLHLGIVSDNTLPRPYQLEMWLNATLPSHPYRKYMEEVLELSRNAKHTRTTHEGNIRAVNGATSKIAKLLHTYIALLYGIGEAKYSGDSPLFKYQ